VPKARVKGTPLRPSCGRNVGAGSDLALGCGPDLMLFVSALRQTGSTHTAAYLSVPPFVGAVLSVVFPGDRRTRATGW
jgi:hypothetical protein